MIKSEQEFKRMKAQYETQKQYLDEQRQEMQAKGYSQEMINLAIGIAETMNHNLKVELDEYEKTRNGQFNPYFCSLDEIGRHLIRLRIWRGITQVELAKRLNVTHSQVSRDERFEYQGASIEKIKAVLDALDVDLIFASPEVVQSTHAHEEYAAGQDELAASKQAG